MNKIATKISFTIISILWLSLGLSAHNDLTDSNQETKETVLPPPCVGAGGQVPWYIYENIESSSLDILYVQPNFPQSPDNIKYISQLATTPRYNNYFGSYIRGFIQAPETGQFQFNITGDDNSMFFLSTGLVPADTTMLAEVPGWSGETEYDKYPEQTSGLIDLIQDEYYYFEVHSKEGSGGDHVRVQWKTPSNSADWEIIHGSHLFEYTCGLECPVKGTTCDDGDANTINDQEDGHCNCNGIPTTLPFTCIGEIGELNALYYDTISGDNIVDLEAASKYPLMPDRVEQLKKFDGPLQTGNQYGTRVRGYISVPVTGDYEFNITGDDETILRLSSLETPAPGSEIATIPDDTDDFEHDKFPSQTSSPIYLQKGNFYSLELLHKENWGSDHFYVFWRTPFAQDTLWRIVDGSYLFEYSCELACIPQGTPCDDNDPQTFNDEYDANCNCIGTPCADPNCSNALGYTPYDACGSTDKHSNNAEDAWLSCQPSQSPNPARGVSHWVQYDFGSIYQLDNAQIWNYNAENQTGLGFENVHIDVSLDGTTWTHLGDFSWTEASGTTDYQGFIMSEFSGINARYVLITAQDNFLDSNCMGISEISFSAFSCPAAGTSCDDGDPFTNNDQYDANCNCAGILNNCTFTNLTIDDNPISSDNYEVEFAITSSGTIAPDSTVYFIAGGSIELNTGFVADTGSVFLAAIVACGATGNLQEGSDSTQIYNLPTIIAEKIDNPQLILSPNPTISWTKFNFTIPEDGEIDLRIFDNSGKIVSKLINSQFFEAGSYEKDFPAHQLAAGIYFVTLRTRTQIITERLVVIDYR